MLFYWYLYQQLYGLFIVYCYIIIHIIIIVNCKLSIKFKCMNKMNKTLVVFAIGSILVTIISLLKLN